MAGSRGSAKALKLPAIASVRLRKVMRAGSRVHLLEESVRGAPQRLRAHLSPPPPPGKAQNHCLNQPPWPLEPPQLRPRVEASPHPSCPVRSTLHSRQRGPRKSYSSCHIMLLQETLQSFSCLLALRSVPSFLGCKAPGDAASSQLPSPLRPTLHSTATNNFLRALSRETDPPGCLARWAFPAPGAFNATIGTVPGKRDSWSP